MRKAPALHAWFPLCLLTVSLAQPSTVSGQARVIEQNGVRYLQQTETVQEPTATVTWEDRKEIVYREQYRTNIVETQRTVLVPVTEYQWEPRVHHWWNPLVPNTIAYHMVPRTRWEARNHTIRYPQSSREIVPEERTVRVPKRELGFEQKERTTLTALAPSGNPAVGIATNSGNAAARVATLPPALSPPTYIGGVQKMEGDLPRYSTRPGGVRGYR